MAEALGECLGAKISRGKTSRSEHNGAEASAFKQGRVPVWASNGTIRSGDAY